MPKTINPSEKWTDTLNVPRAGEGVKAAGVELPFSDLLANDKYLHGLIDTLTNTPAPTVDLGPLHSQVAALMAQNDQLHFQVVTLEGRLAALEARPTTGTTVPTPEPQPTPTELSVSVSAQYVGGFFSLLLGSMNVSATITPTLTADTTITNITWDWGDGTVENQDAAILTRPHTYHDRNPHTIQVNVTDSAGQTANASTTIAPPENDIKISFTVGSEGRMRGVKGDVERLTLYTLTASAEAKAPATIVSYEWVISKEADNTVVAQGTNQTIQFTGFGGNARVVLYATDSNGLKNGISHTILTDAPEPI